MMAGRLFFDKPIESSSEFSEMASLFTDHSSIHESVYLGEVPNVTLRVSAEPGPLAVRVYNNGYATDEHLALEIAYLHHLSKVECPGSPHIFDGLDGSTVQHWRGYRVIAMKLLPGNLADEVDVDPLNCYKVGAEIARLTCDLGEFEYSVSDDNSFWRRSERLLRKLSPDMAESVWGLDVDALAEQLEGASTFVRAMFADVGLIPTDIWSPNVLIYNQRLSGIVDFDDMALGPRYLDIAAALSKFAAYSNLNLDNARFRPMIDGYRSEDGAFAVRVVDALVTGVVVCYVSWLACNALHGVPFVESAVYIDRLRVLQDSALRERFRTQIMHAMEG
jgi:Ser/Thr protein kinase RdoA (MazF antagonist)